MENADILDTFQAIHDALTANGVPAKLEGRGTRLVADYSGLLEADREGKLSHVFELDSAADALARCQAYRRGNGPTAPLVLAVRPSAC